MSNDVFYEVDGLPTVQEWLTVRTPKNTISNPISPRADQQHDIGTSHARGVMGYMRTPTISASTSDDIITISQASDPTQDMP